MHERIRMVNPSVNDSMPLASIATKALGDLIRRPDGGCAFELSRDQWNHLRLVDAGGTEYLDATVVPLFPVTASHQWISIVSNDGIEIACLDSFVGLSDSSIALIQEELQLRELNPTIEKVISVSGTQEPCEWYVQTNHGPIRFVLKSEEDVRRISAKAVNITDANGIRFRVDDMKKLDKRSRAFVEWYV